MTQKGFPALLKNLSKIFPLFDHLYIFQILEYNSWDFLKWFLKNPFKRNLQKKHKLIWTLKVQLLAVVSITLLFLDSATTSYLLTGSPSFLFFLLMIKFLYFPLFLVIAQILIFPLEFYWKEKILSQAKNKLSKLPNLKVVAITGSFGKTSTKDILYTLLFKKYYVVKTPKSYNTPLGIAQTILDLIKENSQVFICEVGAYKKGEIAGIGRIIKPNIAIITAIAPQHLEKFGSLENIAKAKFELLESLSKNGLAILNGEYDPLRHLPYLPSHIGSGNVVHYGRNEDRYCATNIKTGVDGTSFSLHTPKGRENIHIPLLGEHHVQNFLAATAAALNLGMTLTEIKERAKLLLPTPHRMEIKKIGNITLIDNSYNTNPTSSESSLKLLASFKNARKIIITPGFVELGKESVQKNRQFGSDIACIADEVIIVGENAKKDLLEGIKQVWPNPEDIVHFTSSTQEALNLAQQLANDIIQRISRYDTGVVALLENDLPDQYS